MTSADRLRAILDLVQDSLDEPELSGADLAGRAYLSRYHFDRLVASALGEPPGAFRRRLLMERAAHRLVQSTDPVIDIAFGAGFGSPEAFTRAFGRSYGRTPSDYRRRRAVAHDLPGASGVHFHPPGGLRLPSTGRSNSMDVLIAMVEHHLDLTASIVQRCTQLTDDVLDAPITLSVEGIDRDPTHRSTVDRLVGQLEMWVSAVQGASGTPAGGDPAPPAPPTLADRLARVVPDFTRLVVDPIREGRAGETFVDTLCEPAQTFTYGGMLAHILTFSAVRRTLAIGALASAGVHDLGSGDPMHAVGGTGTDAAYLTRAPSQR